MSHFGSIALAPADEIFNTGIRYRADASPDKVDLGVGAYRTDEGKPLVLSVVRKGEDVVHANKSLNHEYLGIDGEAQFVTLARQLMFGKDSAAIAANKIATVQGISGTGSLRVGFEFVQRFLPKGTTILYSTPTWGNHIAMFEAAHLPTKKYRYWNAQQRCLDIENMCADIEAAPNGSVVLLHACAHNPTGVDPTQDQWRRIAKLLKSKNHLPFFDSAYQGFASGDLEKDAWAIRYFVDEGFSMLAAQSFAKNFGLYNERIGTISAVCQSDNEAKAVLSQLKMVVRPMYSNPPAQGARVVAAVLSDPKLYEEWRQELRGMSERIQLMRQQLRAEIERLGTSGSWNHITDQIGMFSFTGLSPAQCNHLIDKHHIYLLQNGRISMAGLNSKNIKYVAKAINDAVTTVQS